MDLKDPVNRLLIGAAALVYGSVILFFIAFIIYKHTGVDVIAGPIKYLWGVR